MRSKKVLVIVVALVACLAIGSATVATAKTKKKKIASTITLAISSTPREPICAVLARVGNLLRPGQGEGPERV